MKTRTFLLWMCLFIVLVTALMALGDFARLHPQVGGVLAPVIALPVTLCLVLWTSGRRRL